MDLITNSLNEKQIEAVKSKNQTTLILAGAGTGKTKVLTSRIAYLISLGVDVSSIMAVTFTNKAAGEMKKRTVDMVNSLDLGHPFYEKDFSIGTFHSICHRMLRKHAHIAGLKSDFTVIDSDEQKKLLKEVIIEKLHIGSEIKDKKEKTKEINKIIGLSVSLINNFKDDGIRPKHIKNGRELYEINGFDIAKVYNEYENEKTKMSLLDFGDLILCVVELLTENKSLKKEYNTTIRHVLVDEFQDTNNIQFKLIELLFNKEDGYLFVVGDDDQSIYEWRGAKIENILDFDKTYKGTLTVKLEQNYRSTNNILKCANHLIDFNEKRMGKALWSSKDSGDLVSINHTANAYAEADLVARDIKRAIRNGDSPNDFAILYRSNYISRIIESKLSENQLPYIIIGGTGFWSRLEIKDLLSYLSLTINTTNNMAFDRIVNTPTRKLGAKKIEQIKIYAIENKISRFAALSELVKNKSIKGDAGKNSELFVNLIKRLNNSKMGLTEKLTILLSESNLIDYYLTKDGEEKGEEREQNLNELINAAKVFKNENKENESDELAFVDYAVLQSTADKNTDGNSVQLMTVHASKGLEFPNVYLMAWEDGIFPSDNALKDGKIEEERRLAYVAITRAEKTLKISSGDTRFPNMPVPISRFFSELPKELLKIKREGQNSRQDYFSSKKQGDWNKSRVINGYKIGSVFEHDKYGTGVILNIINKGSKIELTINFKGFIGVKKLFIEN